MGSKSDTTEAVRHFAAANGTLSKKEARESLGLSVDQVARAVDNLVKTGHLRRLRHGIYQFIDAVERPPVERLDKIWRAMKISGSFSAAEIARLADSSTAYVYKRFRQYTADGYIRRAGARPTHGSGMENLWRLTNKGKAKAQQPRVEAWKPDPVVMATVSLNRLMCSGAAMRDKETARMAMEQITFIQAALEAVIEEK